MKKLALTAAVVAALAGTAHADDLTKPMTLEIEVVDTTKKTSQTATFTFTIASERGCAEASSDTSDLRFHVEVCHRSGPASAPVLGFDVRRVEVGKTTMINNHLKVSSQLAAGKRAVVGKITRGDEATEIAATVRQ